MEQEEYKKEEIDWSYIEFVDNQDILDLIEKVFVSNSAMLKWLVFISLIAEWCMTISYDYICDES